MTDADHPLRLAREESLRRLQAAEVPPPPYHIHGSDLLYFLCRFDPEAARRLLPAGLEMADPAQGVICVIEAPEGWAIAPFLKGPASSRAVYLTCSTASAMVL